MQPRDCSGGSRRQPAWGKLSGSVRWGELEEQVLKRGMRAGGDVIAPPLLGGCC